MVYCQKVLDVIGIYGFGLFLLGQRVDLKKLFLLSRLAALALYKAKSAGKNQVVFNKCT